MESEGSTGGLDVVTQCPLCQTPVGSRDELQLHYLTSCSGYDKGNGGSTPKELEVVVLSYSEQYSIIMCMYAHGMFEYHQLVWVRGQ